MEKLITHGKKILRENSIQMMLWAGFVSGTLDGMAASSVFYLTQGLYPDQVMQFIASAIFGPEAFKGGTPMIITGIIAHYLIAIAFAGFYFALLPFFKILRQKPVISGLTFGAFIWLLMNLAVLPLSAIQSPPIDLTGAIISILWHMILVGLPISLIAKRQYDVGNQ